MKQDIRKLFLKTFLRKLKPSLSTGQWNRNVSYRNIMSKEPSLSHHSLSIAALQACKILLLRAWAPEKWHGIQWGSAVLREELADISSLVLRAEVPLHSPKEGCGLNVLSWIQTSISTGTRTSTSERQLYCLLPPAAAWNAPSFGATVGSGEGSQLCTTGEILIPVEAIIWDPCRWLWNSSNSLPFIMPFTCSVFGKQSKEPKQRNTSTMVIPTGKNRLPT